MRSWRLGLLLGAECVGALLLCWLNLRLSQHGFSGYDVSPMIDGGWRLLSGQVPGRDFVATFPPSLSLSVMLCFRTFGVNWPAIGKGADLLFLLLVLLGCRAAFPLRRALSERAALFVSAVFFAAQAAVLLSVNYLWHAAMVEQIGAYAVLVVAAVCCGEQPPRGWARLELLGSLGIAMAALLLSKPNTALPLLLLLLVVVGRRLGARACLLPAVLAVVLASAALVPVHTQLWAMLRQYSGLTGRLLPLAFANGLLYQVYARYALANLLTYALLAPALFGAGLLLWRRRRGETQGATGAPTNGGLLLLGGGSVLVGLLGMGTNFDYKLTDTPLVLLGLALLCVAMPGERPLRFRTGCAALALLLVAAFYGRSRLRMQTVGSWADDKCGAQVVVEDRFLGRMTVCPVVEQTQAAIETALQGRATERVFFGPALEFEYAAQRRESPRGLPNWWDPGSSYARRDEAAVVAAWRAAHFDLLIFPEDEDRGQLPAAVAQTIEQEYVPVERDGVLHVYAKRGRTE